MLERLEDPNTRKSTRIFLSDLHKRFDTKEASDKCLETYHFQIQDIYLEQYEGYLIRKLYLKSQYNILFVYIYAET